MVPSDLSILNENPCLLEGELLLHHLVRLSSDAVAIDFLNDGKKRRKLSYETLHSLSNALAGRLIHLAEELKSTSPIIPVLIPQCPELYVVLLSVLKAGKAFCPLLLDTPTERLEFILQDISADFLITLSPHYETLRTKTRLRIFLADHEMSHDSCLESSLPSVNTHELAYVLYTSGSTGLPKAVKVSHRAATQSLLAHDRHIPRFARFLQFAAPTFDVSIFEIFFPWFRGQTLVGCSRSQMLDDLPKLINDLEVDAAELTPTVASSLLDGRSSVPGLKLLLTIGEMLNQHVIDEFGGDDGKESILWAMYGPTEAAIHCTVQPRMSSKSAVSTIGLPLDTVSAFILAPSEDGDLGQVRILPMGEVGELAIGGPQVADGYLNRPELSTAVFVDHPLYGRMYRTGDRASIRSDGCLDCLGRITAGQVKLRGQRVELGEIEQAIMRIDGCHTSTVMIIDDKLVAFCTVDSDKISRSHVLEYCKEWLPSFMVPSDICFLNSIPQLASGKIDRNLLKSQYQPTSAPNGIFTSESKGASTSSLEDPINRTIMQVLRTMTNEEVGLNTSLASVGIDSLRCIQLASVLRREGFALSGLEVLAATNVTDLIAACKTRIDSNGENGEKRSNGTRTPHNDQTSIGTRPANQTTRSSGSQASKVGQILSETDMLNEDSALKCLRDGNHSEVSAAGLHSFEDQIQKTTPCTPLQEAMLAETSVRSSAYCNWIEVELSMPYTYAQILDGLRLVCQSNDILRTGFAPNMSGAGTYVQIVWKELEISQIRQVSRFSRCFSLSSNEALLHPLHMDVQTNLERPRILIKLHHAIYDGWSFDLLLQDLERCLRMETVPPRPQFGDVADYFTHGLQASECARSREYWKEILHGFSPTVLPNFNGKTIRDKKLRRLCTSFRVTPRLLFQQARNLGVSPQTYFQAATAFLLKRYSGSNDVTFGNVISGRTIPVTGIEDIMGPCIASLPFRINLEDTTQVQDLLHRTQQLNREGLHHSAFSLREITKAVGVQPGTRLFDVLFVWQQSVDYKVTSEPPAVKIVDSADELEMKLTLEFEPTQDSISFRATYDCSIFPELQIEYLAQQIEELVHLFLKDTSCAVTALDCAFTPASLSIQNPTPSEYPIQHGPSHAVEEWAIKYPDRAAICFGHMVNGVMQPKETATYAALNSRANQLARVLSQHATHEDQLIGIIMEKSVDLYVSILAVSKLGCGYLPLVPDTPADRISMILGDAQIVLCISSSGTSPLLPRQQSLKVLEVDLINLEIYPNTNLNIAYKGHHLAYAIFTSGSTGTPKGVLVTQNNLMSNLLYLSGVYPYSADSRMLQACSQAFDVSVFEIFFAWHTGMCLCTAIKDDMFRDFEASIRCFKITHLSLTPTVAALVNPKNVPRVELLVTAGEALTEKVRRKWAGRGLYQGYGPSETTNICTVQPSVSMYDLINNIGVPFNNTSAFVLDPDGDSFLPRGAVGELCFGGTQVFRGYLNRPELNSTKLIEHPSYGRIYRSGDMGIMLPDGALLSTGRSDDQVKIRGQRVELREITSVALDDAGVQDCVTLMLSDRNDGSDLVSFWVPVDSSSEICQFVETDGQEDVVLRLFHSMSRRLPLYMVPSHIVSISRIPMTTQAKIDKRLLQNIFHNLTEDQLNRSTHSEVAGQDSELSMWEQSVALILTKLLDLPLSRIQKNSSFFGLGLDSVSAIRLSNDLRRSSLGDFTVSTILKNSSLAQLAAIRDPHGSPEESNHDTITDLGQVFTTETVSTIMSIFDQRGARVSKILPCTPLQEAMLSSAESSSSSAYCNVMIFEVTGQLTRLQESWLSMIQRHEIFRTAFVPTNDPSHAFAQVVLEGSISEWHLAPVCDDLHSHMADAISTLLSTHEPPIRLAIEYEGESTKLLFGCHHALYDGSAIAILLQEIQALYNGYTLPPPITYEVYLQHVLSQDVGKADQYWSSVLSDFTPTLFPILTGEASRSDGSASSVTRCLQMSLSEARGACQEASTSLLSVIQATWAKLLHFYTGESDFCFGNVVSGRNLQGMGLERLVAPCFNTLPVRVNFDFHQANSSLVRLTHSLNIEMLAYQMTPLRRIQASVLKDGGILFDTLVILQQPAASLDASIWTLERDLGDMDLPVVCEIIQDPAKDCLELKLHYNTSLLSETDAALIAHTFEDSFLSVLGSPHASANDTNTLPPDLRAESHITIPQLDSDARFLHSGFERMAAENPNHIALDFLNSDGSKTIWSFGTLNAKANDIAHMLISNNVSPEDIVPLHLPKCLDFYAGILGILKAGAAFAPVHPDLPVARKQLMLDELNPRLILCSQNTVIKFDGAMSVVIDSVERRGASNPVIHGLRESSLAYCLFTSGSTGVPKAVSMEHRAPTRTIESSRGIVPWNSSSRLLQYAAITFDMCYYDCFLAWTFGFTLCAAGQDLLLNELPRVITDLNASLLDLTPSVAVSLRKSEIPSVEWLYCIGEAMSSEVVTEWAGACANSYGPTEAAFCTTIFPISAGISTAVIGKPFPGTSFAIFPTKGDFPLPVLSTGELYIGGAQLARGYLGQPELTNDRFVHIRGQRFYKTGDIVRMLSNGNFEFVGRADDQVKIRGLRVELGEINHVLLSASQDVKSVVTQIMESEKTTKAQLVVFLVMGTGLLKEEESEVRRKLRDVAVNQLPAYMVPQFFIFLKEIPRSMAGKVDKRILAEVFRDHVENDPIINGGCDHTTQHRWTLLEQQVREIMAQLSRTAIEEIAPTTTIYQLGLDSISAVQIAAALRKQGHIVKAADIMRHMTCVGIAKNLTQNDPDKSMFTTRFDFDAFHSQQVTEVSQSCGIPASDILAIRPCTPLQKGMASQFISKEGSVYMNHIRVKMERGYDASRLKSAWNVVMSRHEMLRTGFAHIRDTQHPFVMVLYHPSTSDLPWMDATNPEPSSNIGGWMQQVQQSALSKLHRPPWALRLVQEDGYDYVDLAIFHGLFDAQSLQIVFNDVAAEYSGRALSPPVALGPVIDGILSSSSECLNEGASFWTELGKDTNPSRFPNLSPLRYDPSPPQIRTTRSAKTIAQLEEGCKTANITLQAAGISSWLSLLSAYTGEASVTCGVVLSGRSFDVANNAVFPCINTVPFACTIPKNRRELLDVIMSLNSQVQQYQFTPLSDIHKLMGYPSEPLFDTIFAYQKLPQEKASTKIWEVVEENATIEYPVSIEIEPKCGYLQYRLTFLPHVIPHEQALLMLGQLDHLMNHLIFDTPLMAPKSDADLKLYSVTPSKHPTLHSEAELLHELVERTAMDFPDRIAFEFTQSIRDKNSSTKRWTYAELDAEGNRIAHLLLLHNIQPGTLIGVCFEKCPQASFAMLGILKAGCAFVAIDPGAPAARQAFIIKDSDACAVLSTSMQSTQFKNDVDALVLNLDDITTSAFISSKPVLKRRIHPQDRSYCLYTSGTTGTPKGCELTHENAVQAMLAFKRLFAGHWDTESRWLQFASFHFDVSVLEQFWSWSVGICVVSAPRDVIFEDLANSISALEITHIDLTPSLAQILHPDDVPGLCRGVFITGGESLKQEILDVWGPKAVIYNGYGPTEATIGCTMYPRVPANGKPSNIGRQFDNVGSFVLRPNSDEPVLRGGVGELCVTGKLVGKGYLNRPELTAERFPYLDRFGERAYRTGDLVRILHDLTFDFLGRADDQVKLRGQRLEVGEINSVIKQCSNEIADAATLVLKHPHQQKEQLISFVVLKGTPVYDSEIIFSNAGSLVKAKEACRDKLPPYMVPTHFLSLATMPLNVNHKADTKKLRQLFENLSVSDLHKLSSAAKKLDESWTKIDQDIRHTLSETLAVNEESISKDSSFFELGMDSISAIGVTQAMKLAGLDKATVSLVMKHSSIRQLAKVLANNLSFQDESSSVLAAQQLITAAQHRHRRAVARALAVSPTAIETIVPCTPLQQGMIARYLGRDSGLYFNTFQLKLNEKIDVIKLRQAWSSLFESAHILRTVFVNTEDGYLQAIIREKPLSWSTHTASEDDGVSETMGELRQRWLLLNSSELTQPFELHILTTPSEQVLVVNIFHGLYDGNSIELMMKSVWKAYNQPGTIDAGPSFHSALSYGPLRAAAGAKDFWQSHLTSATFRPFPSLVDEPNTEPITVTRRLEGLSALDPIRRGLNVTAQAIAQSCWLKVLRDCTKAVITTGLIVSGRTINLDGAERIIGPMFNTIPYQHHIRSGDSWAVTIKRVHEFNVAAQPYQHTPLRDIMKWCKGSADQPLFDTLFVYQAGESNSNSWKNELWETVDGDAVADYPLAFEVSQMANDSLQLTLVAQGHISDKHASERLLNEFEENLRQVLVDPNVECGIPDEAFEDDNEPCQSQKMLKPDVTRPADFKWTDPAIRIREEVASLSGIDKTEISEITSIFELGLDSIDAIKLSSKLKKHGINLPVSKIMRSLTITRMMEAMTNEDTRKDQESAQLGLDEQKCVLQHYLKQCDGISVGIESVLPLTPLQEAMIAEMIASDYTRYYNYDVLKVDAHTDVEKLRVAWTRVVEASPILRTGFMTVDDPTIDLTFAQITHQHPHEFWSSIEIDHEPDFSTIFDDLRSDALNTALSIPPVRLVFLKTPQQSYVILAIAHALYDGWSLGLIHADVERAYRNQHEIRPSYEPVLASILSSSGDDAAGFWKDYLSDAKISTYPRRGKTMGQDGSLVYRHEMASSASLVEVTAFARETNVSLQTVGQASFAMVLASYVKSLDVTFGSVLSGRDDDERAQLLFPTMNTVAIRTILHGSRADLIRYMQSNFSSIKAWQHFPLRKSLSLAGIKGQLFESLFIYQKASEDLLQQPKRLYTSVEGRSDVEYPVCVEMEVVGEQLVWRCAAKAEVFTDQEARELLTQIDAVLRRVMQDSDAPVVSITESGTSVCGLPAFEDTTDHTGDEPIIKDEEEGHENLPDAYTVQTIKEILAQVSKTPRDEITDDMTLFHMGLDSISAIKVATLLRQKGIILSVGEMLRAGSIQKMGSVIATRATETTDQNNDYPLIISEALRSLDKAEILERIGIDLAGVEEVLPVTAGQLYMLSMWINTNGSNFYPVFEYELAGSISFETLQKSWKGLVKANPILRTAFAPTYDDGVPYVQVVLRETDSSVTDFTGKDQEDSKSVMHSTSLRQPWAHLFVAKRVNAWDVTFRIHHALYDGVSLPLLMQQYQNICNGVALPSPTETFTRLIATSYAKPALQDRKAFWTNYLREQPSRISPPSPSSAPSAKTEIFTPALLHTSSIEATARKHGLSTHSLFLASYAKLHAKLTRTPSNADIVLGIYLANRSLPLDTIASVAIPTVNPVPLRIATPTHHSILALATAIQTDLQNISAPANACTSLFEISKWTGVTLNTFVNFLTLPVDDGHDNDNELHQSPAHIRIRQKSQWREPLNRVVQTQTGGDYTVPITMVNKRVNAAYKHAIDVEATVRNGALDMGVFAPAAMLSRVQGEELVAGMKEGLLGVGV